MITDPVFKNWENNHYLPYQIIQFSLYICKQQYLYEIVSQCRKSIRYLRHCLFTTVIFSIYAGVAVWLSERLMDSHLEDKDPGCTHYDCKNPCVANLLCQF